MVEDWWILFYGRDTIPLTAWYDRVLHRQFVHCLAFGWSGGHWVMVDPMRTGTEVYVLAEHPSGLDWVAEYPTHMVHVKARRRPGKLRCGIIGFQTCVERIKDLIGCRSPFVITPRQLYKWSLRNAN